LSLQFLEFSTIYRHFTSCSQNTQRGEDSICEGHPGTFQKITDRSLVCTKLSGTIWGFAMWSKGLEGGVARRIPVRPAVGVAGKLAREGLGVVGIRLGGLHTVERRLTVGCGGRRRRRPLRALLRRACSLAWPTSGRGSFAGARGRREQHVSAVKGGRRWSSP
jgi:hypothetical protein